MKKSSASMGMRKHGKSGKAPKSPKARHLMELEAQRDERKPRPSQCVHQSVADALGAKE